MSDILLNALNHKGYRTPEDPSIPMSMRTRDLTLVRAKVVYVDLERLTMTCEVFFTSAAKAKIAIIKIIIKVLAMANFIFLILFFRLLFLFYQ